MFLWVYSGAKIELNFWLGYNFNIFLQGCRPPEYLFWFKGGYQKLLNNRIQEGFQEYADHYKEIKSIPKEFSPFKDAYVQYKITDLIWSKDHVKFAANAKIFATLNGKNVTFIPQNSAGIMAPSENQTMKRTEIPLEEWNMQSVGNNKSYLLQGVRISTEFINSLIWFASLTNKTK